MAEPTTDKRALLDELKIDRNASVQSEGSPVKWIALMAAAIVGIGVWWFWPGSTTAQVITVDTVLARSAAAQPEGSSVLDATGYVVARRQATVSSKATGKVVEVLIEEGVVVEKDQLLASLDDSIPRAQYALAESQLASAEASLAELEISLRQAELDLDRTQGLAQRQLASQADLDRDSLSVQALIARLSRAKKDIEVASRSLAVQQRVLDDMQIRAPFAGVVIAKAAQPGEMISPVSAGGGFTRTGICTIVDMDSLEVEVDVNESYINRVYSDQPVDVTLNAYSDHKFAARVIAIIPAADRNKATVRVRIGFIERDARILPDMGVRVSFLEQQDQQAAVQEAPTGVLVPKDAVGSDEQGRYVMLVTGETVSRRAVRIGTDEGTRARVLTGLSNGDRVVAGLAKPELAELRDGSRIQYN